MLERTIQHRSPVPKVVSKGALSAEPAGVCACRYLLNTADSSSNGSNSSSPPAPGSFPPLAGAAFLASVPPSGNRDLIFRWLRRDLGLSWRVTW